MIRKLLSRLAVAAVLAGGLAAGPAWAQYEPPVVSSNTAFTHPAGTLRATPYIEYQFPAGAYYNLSGGKLDDGGNGTYKARYFGLATDYAITDALGLQVDLPFARQTISGGVYTGAQENFQFYGFRLGARYAAITKPFYVTPALTLQIPVLYDEDPQPDRYGDGRIAIDARVWVGKKYQRFEAEFGPGFVYFAEAAQNRFAYVARANYAVVKDTLRLGMEVDGHYSTGGRQGYENPFDALPAHSDNLVFRPRVIWDIDEMMRLSLHYSRNLAGVHVPSINGIGVNFTVAL